ncbi:MAG: GGDEF domain-containing protein [Chloroflexi bacterium]|nr:GGDEF domain-containing protein [Chloroflexota bacterium]
MTGRLLARTWQSWRWRRAAVVAISAAVTTVVALLSRGVASVPIATGMIVASSIGSLTLLLYIVDRLGQLQQAREEGLRRIRQYGERLAIYDRETGLYAYWYFSLRLEEELARSHRYKQACTLLLVESLQGRLGPDEEQRLLRSMTASFRSSDLVAHLGNLRFVVLLTSTDAEGALVVVRRFRASVAPNEVHVGLASYPADGQDWPSLLKAAGASSDVINDAQRGIDSVNAAEQESLLSDGDRSQTAA